MMPYNFHKENPWLLFSSTNTRQRSQESQKNKSRNFKGYGIEECMNEMKKKCKSKKEKEGKKEEEEGVMVVTQCLAQSPGLQTNNSRKE